MSRLLVVTLLVVVWTSLGLANSVDSQVAYAIYDEDGDEYILVNKEPPREKLVAWANFTNSINHTGWANFEVWTNGLFPDTVQVKAAGYLEGYLTHELIYMYYLNTLQNYCQERDQYCSKLKEFLSVNTKWVQKVTSKLRKYDPFWHHVALFYEQMDGMTTGWLKAAEKTGHSMGDFGFLWFNIFGDMEEFEQIFGLRTTRKDGEPLSHHLLGSGSCSALIKLLPDLSDLYASHVTWNGYESMIRLLKKYHFEIHETSTPSSPLIPGHSMSFSSYPGLLYSGDDFTVLSSGMVSMETTIGNSNPALWKFIKPVGQVLEGVRATVANRLATSGKDWTSIFARRNSGTYNNQWMVIDYKQFKPKQPLRDGLLWVLEQLPSLVVARDMTSTLRNQSYWPSYNSPYYPEIFNLSGTPDLVAKYGDWFTYDKTPRALIFRRDHTKVRDMDSMIRLMRYNDYQNDPLSRCEACNPPYSAENAISARNDLNPVNGTYPFRALSHRSHGGTDCKVTSLAMMSSLDFIAVGGPTYDPLPPFQWSKSDFQSLSHVGQPDLWKFSPIRTQWSQ